MKRRVELNLFQRIQLELMWSLCWLFAVLPHWFKYYVIEQILFFVLCYCLRYRRKVVMENLRRSFPDKSERELARIRRGFYHTLSQMFIDTLNMAHMGDSKARRALGVDGLEEHHRATLGMDWVALVAHFGCWEYAYFWNLYEPTQVIVAVYHPLHGAVAARLYERLRSFRGARTVPMQESLRFYLRNRDKGIDGKNMVMGLIADQNPPRRSDSHWFRFLNQDTIFFDGGEKLALRCNLPVYFVRMDRVRRGRYRMSFELLYDGKEEVGENVITERYVRHLERMIEERPELWMWSHRRWKHKRTDADS